MSKTITIPDIGQNPIILRINCTEYVFHAGVTATVPDEVAALLAGIVESYPQPAEDGYRTKPATIGDVEDMIAASGGSKLPEVTTDDNGKFLGVTEGEWATADAPSGGGPYDVPFTVTNPGTEEQTCTTDADYDEAFSAVQAGKINVRAVTTFEIRQGTINTVYLPVQGILVDEEGSTIKFSFVVNMGGPTYVELAWNGEDDPTLSFTPLTNG